MKVRNEYKGKFESRCPVDGSRDNYDVEIESEHTIPVEDLLEYFENAKDMKIFQEDHGANLAKLFEADVQIKGWHSGILIVSQVYWRP